MKRCCSLLMFIMASTVFAGDTLNGFVDAHGRVHVATINELMMSNKKKIAYEISAFRGRRLPISYLLWHGQDSSSFCGFSLNMINATPASFGKIRVGKAFTPIPAELRVIALSTGCDIKSDLFKIIEEAFSDFIANPVKKYNLVLDGDLVEIRIIARGRGAMELSLLEKDIQEEFLRLIEAFQPDSLVE